MNLSKFYRKIVAITIYLVFTMCMIYAQAQTLDNFETKDGWHFIKSDGVDVDLSVEKGHTGNAIRFDYDFAKGTGYGGIQKFFPIDLPENYEFTFYIKAESPANNLEIKFIDSTGNNVWWMNNHNYNFPKEWTKIKIKKRHIQFAWGPTEDKNLNRIDRIEFTVSSFVGGKGTIWLDDLKFELLPPERNSYPEPVITATSFREDAKPGLMIDASDKTSWQSLDTAEVSILVDFKVRREFGGLQIKWLKDHSAKEVEVQLSDDNKNFDTVYAIPSNRSNVSFIRLSEAEARYLKIILKNPESKDGFGITELKFLNIENSMTMNDFLIYAAKNSPQGDYPRYFNKEASYWTVTGVNSDVKESLINEDGMVEVEKGHFSIEPMIKVGDTLYNWSNVKAEQSLGDVDSGAEFSFIPTVEWPLGKLNFKIEVTSSGDANMDSELDVRYSFANSSEKPIDLDLYLLVRPFQVNPYYQWLNQPGGAGKIHSIGADSTFGPDKTVRVDERYIVSPQAYDDFGACTFDNGNIVDMIRQGIMPEKKKDSDIHGLAGGVIKYSIHLEPGEHRHLTLIAPNYNLDRIERKLNDKENYYDEFAETDKLWEEKVNHIRFNLPASADRIIKTYKDMLVYILINKDKAGIQPGSRSYERSWIRDGALTSSALLKSGIVDEVRDFIIWYTSYQYESGKVPCVVDFRGPDPVPENDSHGEMIYLIREYFNFTKDTAFLRAKNEHVLRAVDYIESLIAQCSTDHYKYGNDSVRAQYGLVPASISHEGYSAKPMHSYWDDFFTMKGLKDAADIQKILGDEAQYERIAKIRDTFRVNLYNSIDLAMKYKGIDYIPGSAELGDFDATSTTIALTPCNELNNLPKPQIYNTFNKYYDYFTKRRDGKIDWVNYTPYENRLIGSFILLDQPEKAHELISFFLHDQRPQGWYQWAEVVWRNYRKPGFIGDMPHTWVGSDFLNAVRNMFVYENEYDRSLELASALYQDWIDAPEGMSVENLPTYYGEISYSILKKGDHYIFNIDGDVDLPENGIKIKNFNGSKMPKRVLVNGKKTKDYNENEVDVKVCPAEVMIYY